MICECTCHGPKVTPATSELPQFDYTPLIFSGALWGPSFEKALREEPAFALEIGDIFFLFWPMSKGRKLFAEKLFRAPE